MEILTKFELALSFSSARDANVIANDSICYDLEGFPDVVLVGAGIMSATLGTLLKQLQPGLTMEIFESLVQGVLQSRRGLHPPS